MAEPTTPPSTNSASFLSDNHVSTIVKTGSETIATATPASPALNPKPVFDFVTSSSGIGLLACAAVLGLMHLLEDNKKGKLAHAYLAGGKELRNARRTAYAQIQAGKRYPVGGFLGIPKGTSIKIEKGERIIKLPEDPRLKYLTNLERGAIAVGGSGSGKTASFINPLLRSLLLQRIPGILYDFKYSKRRHSTDEFKGQAPPIAGYGLRLGYKIYVIAPGFKESLRCNPLDFLRSKFDSEMAGQLAVVLNRNFKKDADKKGDPFFTESGDQLSKAIILLAKGSKYQDILMCYAILSLPDLSQRLQAKKDLNLYVKAAFTQFLASAGSPETAASIISTAMLLFTRFASAPGLLSTFCGTTNIPLDFNEGEMLILGLDKETRNVVAPLIAAIMQLLATRNLAKLRSNPIFFGLDEIWTLYVDFILDILAQDRESGAIPIIGVQTLDMLEAAFGAQKANAIYSNCNTKALLNPGDERSAERFSKLAGEKDVRYKLKTVNRGKERSSSYAEHLQVRPLIAASEFTTFCPGKGVLFNSGQANSDKTNLPWIGMLTKLTKKDKKAIYEDSLLWEAKQQELAAAGTLENFPESEIQLRLEEAERMLPLPGQQHQNHIMAKYNEI